MATSWPCLEQAMEMNLKPEILFDEIRYFGFFKEIRPFLFHL